MLTIIIPCFNEEKNLNKLLEKIKTIFQKYNFIKVILVDNGSSDNTKVIIKKNSLYSNNNFNLVVVKKNIGYGNGILKGIDFCNTEYISWTHADLQTDLEDVPRSFIKFKNIIIKGNVMIKGRRKNRNFIDGFFTFFMSVIASIFTFSILKDVNAQPKIFPRNFIANFENPPHDFMLDLYLLIIASKKISKY